MLQSLQPIGRRILWQALTRSHPDVATSDCSASASMAEDAFTPLRTGRAIITLIPPLSGPRRARPRRTR